MVTSLTLASTQHRPNFEIVRFYLNTRLISIESQPKKIAVVVVVVVGVVVVGVHVVVVVIHVVDPRNIPLKFGKIRLLMDEMLLMLLLLVLL